MPQTVQEIPFGEWLPDHPDYRNPGCIEALNCYPSVGGYSPFLGGAPQGASQSEAIHGAMRVLDSSGKNLTLLGGRTVLSIMEDSNGPLTETTGYTDPGDDDYWDFALFNSRAIAVAPNNSPQQRSDINVATYTWAALGGSPPEAKHVGRVGSFLVLGNLSGLSLPYTIQWSAENDPTDWPTPGTNDARLKSSGRAALQPEYGPITGFAGDRYPMVFQERGIFRMEPVGPPIVFDVRQPVSEARGCIAPQSLVTVGFLTFYLSHDGFFATDGNQEVPIAGQKVNEWFFDNVRVAKAHLTQGAINWKERSIVWSFYKGNAATGLNAQIIYSWEQNRWSRAEFDVDWLVEHRAIDPITAAESEVLGAFIQNARSYSEFNLLTERPLQATFETGAYQPKPGSRIAVNGVYPRIEAPILDGLELEDGSGVLLLEDGASLLLAETGNVQAALISHDFLGNPSGDRTDGPRDRNEWGLVPLRGEGRYARIRMIIPTSDWEKAQGVAVEYRVAGRR